MRDRNKTKDTGERDTKAIVLFLMPDALNFLLFSYCRNDGALYGQFKTQHNNSNNNMHRIIMQSSVVQFSG